MPRTVRRRDGRLQFCNSPRLRLRADGAKKELGCIDRTEGIEQLPLDQKLKLAGLLCVKAVVVGITFLVNGVMRLMKAAERV